MRLTARQLNRATLARQLLLRREPLTVEETVGRVLALQAQQPASPYLALWCRVDGFDPAHLDAALAERRIVKATLMRVTLHAVHVDDHATLRQAVLSTLRAARLNDRRFAATGLSIDDADALVPHLVAFADEPRTRREIEAHLAGRLGGPPHEGVWWALRSVAPLLHHPTGGPWSFGTSPVFRAPPDRRAAATDPALAVQELIRRYLAAFGPASARDVAQFALLRQSTLRPAFDALAATLLRREGPDGAVLWDVEGGEVPDEDVPAPPRLLPMWDSTLLAYADRSRIIPDEHRPLVIRRNGDVLPAVLVDGLVRGVWRPVDGRIEVTAFEPLSEDAWDGLAVEAAALLDLLADRDPGVYGRYRNWWDELPDAETRPLPP
jgi:hypothetical protein